MKGEILLSPIGEYMSELPHKLPNNLKYRKSRIFKEIPEINGIDGKVLSRPPKNKFLQMCHKIAKIRWKTFHRKTLDLFPIFYPKLSEETFVRL